jgi:transposase InsO family protein
MQRESIVAACQQRFKNTSTFSRELAAAPNLLQRRFRVSAPNQVWVTDMTFLSTRQGWIHLCAQRWTCSRGAASAGRWVVEPTTTSRVGRSGTRSSSVAQGAA